MSEKKTVSRTEKDALGTVEVPLSALWGAQTARALQNFPISGKTAPPPLLRALLRVKKAAAIANQKSGNLPAPEAGLIIEAVDELLAIPESEWPSLFPVDPFQAGAGTSQNMNANEVIANLANRRRGIALGTYAPIHPNDHVNRAQSTNDVYPTALRLATLESSAALVAELRRLSEALARKSQEWETLPKSARTHLQDAVPIFLGAEFSGYACAVSRCADWLESSREALRELGIGGSAAGTGLNVPVQYIPFCIEELARLTGEPLRASPNLYYSMQSQAPLGHYSSMLRLTALEMTRICNDLRLLASGPHTGLAELLLPAVQPGSSMMPGKVNPSIVEMANQAWYWVLGQDQTVQLAAQAGQLELNVMMPIMAFAALEATATATHATRVLRERCIEGLQPNEPRLRHYFETTPQIATALVPRLGYAAVAALVHESLEAGKSVIQLVRERQLIPPAELESILAAGLGSGTRRLAG